MPPRPELPPCIGCGAPLPEDAECLSACTEECQERAYVAHGEWVLGRGGAD